MSELEEKNCSLEDCTSSLKSTVRNLIASLSCVKGSICCCCDHLLSPEPHLDTKMEEVKEGEDEEESELEYKTDEELEVDASESSYLTPIPGASPPTPSLLVPTHSPTPDYKGLDQLAHKTIKHHIEDFLVKAEEDLELSSNPPPLETPSSEPIPAPEPICPFKGFVPFTVSLTDWRQCCIPSHGLPVRALCHLSMLFADSVLV